MPFRRVLYIHHGHGIGGATLSLLFLIEKLDRSRYEPVVACLYDGPAADRYRKAGIQVVISSGIDHFGHSSLAWYSLRRPDVLARKVANSWPSVIRTERLVKDLNADLVHLNTSGLPASAIGAHRAGVPIVWHIREPIHHGYIGLRRALLRWLIDRYGDRVIPICDDNARQLIPSDRVRVIRNFVDFTQFDRSLSGHAVRKELGVGSGAKLVLMLGGIAIPKGTLPFAQAMPSVVRSAPDTEFVVAGSIPAIRSDWGSRLSRIQSYRRRLDAFVTAHGLSHRVHFAGVRSDVPELLAASDVLVFPSVVPHFARPIIEAGAMATPVVASRLPGPDELVIHGETGLLVPPSEPDALAAAIVGILLQPELARAMGEAGYRRARELYNAEVNAAQTFALYDELLCEGQYA